ncbi:MAG: hypothetical protein JGK24_01540 [Microcoleus sp. PH2017_29_MFU_D_A]|uniref:hypothetical protein n=1 Tax=unclassified Microcoleus TaxID=2642155 RepID=UPI001D880185|nr:MULTISPECIES: hypothetical protein [unclassified Microcoleus]MCC3498429.1 hypothetical protein [Microcoleus sp. PH2017_15_JOR_U_A]MCC3601935.1 hypothetical protein [Microcoleus sp. PH2017_29_MFU_D_A]MCC3633162.1 hypothetical protein [Microcoleus sp. PH2017_37_MFU_D_B]
MKLKAIVDTVLKKRPIQSTELSNDEKFDFKESDILEIEEFSKAQFGHLKIVLANPIKGSKDWFVFERHISIAGNLNIGVQGADSAINVNSDLIVGGATRLLGGAKPAYWGRYFSGTDFSGFGEYKRREENNILRRNNIRVLPIGRFTTRVGFGEREGDIDGTDQALDFLATFGEDYLQSQGGEFYFFLDVEPSDPLSTEYYLGWSKAVIASSPKIKMLPGVYLGSQDDQTSTSLKQAMNRGAECHGLWIARFDNRFRTPSIPIPPLEFDAFKAQPNTDVPCPVLFWQYAGEIGTRNDFDFNVSNPDVDFNALLKRLVLPQAI